MLKSKSFDFALSIIECYRFLVKQEKEFNLSRQLLKSGTAVGALYREAEQAESRKDFIHKLSIAQKECNEVDYWIDLLYSSQFIDESRYRKLKPKCIELMKILTSIIKSTKAKN